ncbi:ABC transporter ATP-binding protein [Aerococcus urinaehominis]|uniref:ABC transporter ATP-binding protein n=1 Tax=Aerococcus urinaehominis TaxID=128944 RepID=A0A109RGY9_9LACT|nr:ABC transporter ATP-binding protein [Aerococcus urinaehominis]AMB99851.1 ABC transporter ATP-binding protein [Aerococcus urinaehominis]SDM63735.1 branched-chain amino acid transport system ATP-binding protein [Aerococcus urinaehominis]
MLKIDQVQAGYGNIIALKEISLAVEAGQIVSLIGANGAGKSTLMKTIMQVIKPKSGQVTFMDQSLTSLPTYKVVDAGIALVPEGRQILESMTVLENLEMGAFQRTDDEIDQDIEKIFSQFPILKERQKQLGGTLSGGQQQMLAIGRALMSRPQLLLLDEPSMGLAPLVVKEIFEVIQQINQGGMTVLLVEQNASKALEIADYAYVMETGKIVLEGAGPDLAADPRVKAAYLGG